MKNNIFIALLFILVPNFVYAKSYCEELNLGWHFYCDPIQEKELRKVEQNKNGTIDSAKSELSDIKVKLEDLKIRAVIYPTSDNILAYVRFQQEQLERATKFSEGWQRLLWQTPDLDYMVQNPISGIGNQLVHEVKRKDVHETLSKLNENYGLFFFYNAKCTYCIKYSPILKIFSEVYKINIMPISVDGEILPEWPDTVIDKGQLSKLGLDHAPVPATILFDNKNKRLIPIGFGVLTVSELEERVHKIIKDKVQHE